LICPALAPFGFFFFCEPSDFPVFLVSLNPVPFIFFFPGVRARFFCFFPAPFFPLEPPHGFPFYPVVDSSLGSPPPSPFFPSIKCRKVKVCLFAATVFFFFPSFSFPMFSFYFLPFYPPPNVFFYVPPLLVQFTFFVSSLGAIFFFFFFLFLPPGGASFFPTDLFFSVTSFPPALLPVFFFPIFSFLLFPPVYPFPLPDSCICFVDFFVPVFFFFPFLCPTHSDILLFFFFFTCIRAPAPPTTWKSAPCPAPNFLVTPPFCYFRWTRTVSSIFCFVPPPPPPDPPPLYPPFRNAAMNAYLSKYYLDFFLPPPTFSLSPSPLHAT